MDLPDGFTFREPAPDDLGPVADVLAAEQLANGATEAALDADFIRQVWSRTGFDLTTDAWILTDRAGTIVAYGQVDREEPDLIESWGVVHPEYRGRGVGSSLLDRIETRATELLDGVPSPRFRHAITAGDAAAAMMLGRRGLRPVRHFSHMQIDLAGPTDPGSTPAGIEIDGIDPDEDLPAIHAILEEAFADDWGDHPEPFDGWIEELASRPNHDATLWLLARDQGIPVGVLTARSGDEGVWVDWLAVLASHRGRGIGAALLRRSFASFAARGLHRVRLNVDAENATGATALYERVGMRVVNRWDLWERTGADRAT
jgi:mycothiol synthase